MKKTFIKLMFCSLLAAASTTFVGCKDYDDDINNQQTQINQLSSQLTALETALNKAQSDATAAATAAATAQKAADDAAAQAALAQKAAATAKAEAIQEVIDQLRPLIDANSTKITENANQIAAILGRIDGIDSSLRNVELKVDGNTASIEALKSDVSSLKTSVSTNTEAIQALNAQLEAANVQIRALELFKEDATDRLDKIEAAIADLQSLRDRIAAVEAQASQNKSDIATLSQKVADNTADILALGTRITEEVNNAVNTIANTLSRRLTSVTLIPDLYVDGIPSIAFKSAAYKVLTWDEIAQEYVEKANAAQEIVSNGSAIAQYRLSPANLTIDDIEAAGLSYVYKVAESRADGANQSDLIKIVDSSIADGVLSVKIDKAVSTSLELADGKINTVALKVPIAESHRFNGETSALVYSEYSRLTETTFQPALSFYGDKYDDNLNVHLYDHATAYAAAENSLVAATVDYSGETTTNLYDLVEACEYDAAGDCPLLTRADLNAYGLDIQFSVPSEKYLINDVDQQAYATINEKGDVVPVSKGIITGASGIAGKQPIILATIVNTNTKSVVAARYFKIKFSETPGASFSYKFDDVTFDNVCSISSVNTITLKEFNEVVLSKLNNGNGIKFADFVATYTKVTFAPLTADGEVIKFNDEAAKDDDIVLSWTTTPQKPETFDGNSTDFARTVTFEQPSGLNGKVELALSIKVNVKPVLSTLGKSSEIKYVDNTLKVYPVPMPTNYDGSTKATYKTNILEGRIAPYFDGLAECDLADVNYAAGKEQPSIALNYQGEQLEFEGIINDHFQITNANQKNLTAIYYSLANTEAAQLLIKNAAKIKLDWLQRTTLKDKVTEGDNTIDQLVGNTYLQLIPVLSLSTTPAESIIDDSRAQQRNLSTFSMVDAYGNKVANTSGLEKNYYVYYGVQDPTYEGTIYLASNPEGTEGRQELSVLNMTANVSLEGVLTFQNNGAPLQHDAYLIVPIQVKHTWGSYDSTCLKGTIAVELKVNSTLPAKRK